MKGSCRSVGTGIIMANHALSSMVREAPSLQACWGCRAQRPRCWAEGERQGAGEAAGVIRSVHERAARKHRSLEGKT